MKTNPYPTQHGFSKRVAKAIAGFRQYCIDGDLRKLHTRSFDDCFEHFDGKAVVWAVMHFAVNDWELERAIRANGASIWGEWLEIYSYTPQLQLL